MEFLSPLIYYLLCLLTVFQSSGLAVWLFVRNFALLSTLCSKRVWSNYSIILVLTPSSSIYTHMRVISCANIRSTSKIEILVSTETRLSVSSPSLIKNPSPLLLLSRHNLLRYNSQPCKKKSAAWLHLHSCQMSSPFITLCHHIGCLPCRVVQ